MSHIAVINSIKTMTSREIAELTGKSHGHVLRDIRSSLEEIYPDCFIGGYPIMDLLEKKGISVTKRQENGLTESIDLPKRECLIMVAGYSVAIRAKIIDRWQELESKKIEAQQPSFNIPTTLSGALRLAAEQAETIEKQAAQIEAAKPAVEFAERHASAGNLFSLRSAAKALRFPEQAFIAAMIRDGFLYRDQSGRIMPYANRQPPIRRIV